MAETDDAITVEVAYAEPNSQFLEKLDVARGATLEQVIAASGLYERYPDPALRKAVTGIWGRETPRHVVVSDGDRIEVYRPLQQDPRVARRERAGSG